MKASQKKIREFSTQRTIFVLAEKGQCTKEIMKRSRSIVSKVLAVNNNEQKHSCLLFI